MFHHESWKPIYFGIKRSKVKVTRHQKTVPAWVSTLLWVLAFIVILANVNVLRYVCYMLWAVRLSSISLFVPVKFNFCRKKSATKFLCMKTSSGKVVATSFPYPTVHRPIAGDVPIYLKLAFKVTHLFRKRRFLKLSFTFASTIIKYYGYFLRQKFSPKNLVFSNISLMAIFAGNHPQRGR